MIVHRIVRYCLFFLLVVCTQQAVFAHGGVVEEDDLCVIKVSYLSAHFKVYQPSLSGHKQFCEDLPAATESVFVMEYQHDSLTEMAIDFRIIRDVTDKGRFARLVDVERIADIETATVFYRAPMIEPDVYAVSHNFSEEGDFIGIVSARHPDTGKLYTAVFPFAVGFTGFGYWPWFVGLLVFMQLQYLFMNGKLKHWFGGRSAAVAMLAFVLVFASPIARADELVVTYTPAAGKPRINRMDSWVLHIENASGMAIEGATIEVDGGMPAHDHGLPTKPRVSKELGGGDYRLEGVRFHMSGDWEIVVTITTDAGTSSVTLALQL